VLAKNKVVLHLHAGIFFSEDPGLSINTMHKEKRRNSRRARQPGCAVQQMSIPGLQSC